MRKMEFLTKELEEAMVAIVNGEVDLQTSTQLRKHLKKLAGKSPLMIDLSGVSYMDSSGVACLVEAFQTSKQKKKGFCLVAISADVQRILELSRLDRVFPIAASENDGLDMMSSG